MMINKYRNPQSSEYNLELDGNHYFEVSKEDDLYCTQQLKAKPNLAMNGSMLHNDLAKRECEKSEGMARLHPEDLRGKVCIE